MNSFFSNVALAPSDPILGLTESYKADTRTQKVNLGVGVYFDENGKIPLLSCVQKAEAALIAHKSPRAYQAIHGQPEHHKQIQKLIFGDNHPILSSETLLTAQSIAGTGALKLGADLLKHHVGIQEIYLPNPSWENHRAIFETAGLKVNQYHYYDPKTRQIDFDALMDSLKKIPPSSVVLLHVCCHNPTGADLSMEQWQNCLSLIQQCGHLPFFDMAYQGFAQGIAEDTAPLRFFANQGYPCLIASSFSKTLSLYGERIGALTLIQSTATEAKNVLSQLKRVIRTNYSNPPIYPAKIVTEILSSPSLRALWDEELAFMRNRIKEMRAALVKKLSESNLSFDFINQQNGMFSYTGLTPTQVEKLRQDFGIYAVSTGRINVAALNAANVDYVADAISKVS